MVIVKRKPTLVLLNCNETNNNKIALSETYFFMIAAKNGQIIQIKPDFYSSCEDSSLCKCLQTYLIPTEKSSSKNNVLVFTKTTATTTQKEEKEKKEESIRTVGFFVFLETKHNSVPNLNSKKLKKRKLRGGLLKTLKQALKPWTAVYRVQQGRARLVGTRQFFRTILDDQSQNIHSNLFWNANKYSPKNNSFMLSQDLVALALLNYFAAKKDVKLFRNNKKVF